MDRRRILFAAFCALALIAADWPQLGRDNTRNAVSPEKGAPLTWRLPGKSGPLARHVLWSAKIGRSAMCPPAVAGGLVWIGTDNGNPRDPGVEPGDAKVARDHAVLMCFREKDGKFLWQYKSSRLDSSEEDYANSPLGCTPLVEGGRLYFTTNRGEVVCLDVSPLQTGKGFPKELWKSDLRDLYGLHLSSFCGMGKYTCSIGASHEGRLYVATGHGVDSWTGKVAMPKSPSLVCLDAKTGKILWRDASPGDAIMRASWSSPLVATVKGRAQVMHAQGDGWLRSFDPKTGALLWKFDLNPAGAKPYKVGGTGEKCFPVAPPTLHGDRLYIATGQTDEDGQGVGHLWCIDPTRTPKSPDKDVSPGTKESAAVWHYGGPRAKPKEDENEWVFGRSRSGVAVHEGLVIAVEGGGWVHCLDAKTGKPHWVADMDSSTAASPLIADGKVYVSTDDGNTWVFALSKEKRLLAQNRGGDGRAGPVFANGVLYLVSGSMLHAVKAGPRGK